MYPTPSTSGSRKRKRTYSGSGPRKKLFRKPRKYKVRVAKSVKKFYKKSLSGARMIKKRVSPMDRYGVHLRYELNGNTQSTASNTQFLALGHISMPYQQMVFSLGNALVKRFHVAMGITVSSFAESINDLVTGDKFTFSWQASTTAAVTNSDVSLTAGNTWNQVVDAFVTFLSSTITSGSELLQVRFIPVSTSPLRSAHIDCQGAYVTFICNSELTIHNITAPDAAVVNDTTDELTAIPLVGKTVVGYGSGTALVRPKSNFTTDVGLWGEPSQSVILRKDTFTQVMPEIPRAEELVNVTKSGKLVMPPGAIRVSKLKSYINVSFNKFLLKYWQMKLDTTAEKSSFGKFAIHFFQKPYEVGTSVALSLNYRCANEIDICIKTTAPKVVSQVVVVDGVRK